MSVNQPINNGTLFEKVMIQNDFSGLSSVEKVTHIKNICDSLGLNPLTKPIQLLKFQNKEIAYFSKDATEQLRKINKISITHIETKILDGSIYVVTATAIDQHGRTDSSTAALSILGLKGESLGNAMMKCETKAKRRVTLSINGLGYMDESEAESIPGAKKLPPVVVADKVQQIAPAIINDNIVDDLQLLFVDYLYEIKNADSLEKLKSIYDEVKAKNFHREPELFKKLVLAKDERKLYFDHINAEKNMLSQLDAVNVETGEVLA